MKTTSNLSGIFAVNKPKGITSHDVVNIIRKLTGEKRVGHGGTLDPLATGVLVVAVRRENTKLLDKYVKGEKEYIAQIRLGFHSSTDDEEGEKNPVIIDQIPRSKDLQGVVKSFLGNVTQIPPIYSAIKLSGTPAYKIARRREKSSSEKDYIIKEKLPVLKARPVFIKSIEILEYHYPLLKIKVISGPGVYIRALARDIGNSLKTAGYLTELTRTRVADFLLKDAISLDQV